jgi:hypothetical protein
MPDAVQAILYVQADHPHADRHQLAMVRWCEARGFVRLSLCFHPQDAAAAIDPGAGRLVVVAVEPDERLSELVAAAGGRVEYLMDATTGQIRAALRSIGRPRWPKRGGAPLA